MNAHPISRYQPDSVEAHKNLRRGTYQDRGRSVGALAGAGLGAAFVGGAHAQSGKVGSRARALKAYAIGTGAGALGGAGIGEIAGTFRRREKPTPKGKEKLFQTMNKSTKLRLISLDAKLNRQVEFVAQREEENHTLRNTAIGAGGLAAAYGAGSYIRGRQSRVGPQLPGVKGVVNDAMAGHGMNVSDVKNAYGKVGAAGVAAKRATEVPLAQATQTMSNAGRSVARNAGEYGGRLKQALNQGVGAMRGKFGKGNISRFPMVVAK